MDTRFFDVHAQQRHTDACGLGFVASLKGERSHETLRRALSALRLVEHRGGVSVNGRSDGAGVATQIPEWLQESSTAAGMVFLPRDDELRAEDEGIIERELERVDFRIDRWRDVPLNLDALPSGAPSGCPAIRQVFVTDTAGGAGASVDLRLHIARRRCEQVFLGMPFERRAYFCSLGSETIVYKALATAGQLGELYTDLTDERFEVAGAVFHRRFSTNTAPAWRLVQPLRATAHNGEFNTLQGNVSWMRARKGMLRAEGFDATADDLSALASDSDSDSVTFDRLFELLIRAGRSPEAAMTMLCPEPYAHMPDMSPEVRAMSRYHSELLEPWDGPAAIVFFGSGVVGAGLDRNGLRPLRYEITDDGWVFGGSEAGLGGADASVIEHGRLGPGQIVSIDLASGRLRRNSEIKEALATNEPYREWVETGLAEREVGIDDVAHPGPDCAETDLVRQQLLFGYAREDLERIIGPMVVESRPPVGSMGDDTPLAALSSRPQSLYRFFKQRFAQVTNPAIDSIRERLNMSLETSLGRQDNFLVDSAKAVACTRLSSPIIGERDLLWLCALAREAGDGEHVATIDCTFEADEDAGRSLRSRMERMLDAAVDAVRSGVGVLILSDRRASADRPPIPMLLAVGAVHERLVRDGLRLRCSIVADTGEPREDHHFACLIGFGATLVLPYLAFRTAAESCEGEAEAAVAAYREAIESGLLKIMAKMGVTVIQSYRGAGLFEIVGLDAELAGAHFPSAPLWPGRVGYAEIGGYQVARSGALRADEEMKLAEDGTYRYRKNGELHRREPDVFKALHKAVRTGDDEAYRAYVETREAQPPSQPRDLLRVRPAGDPLSLSAVEGNTSIVRRLSVQAMSHGALSREVHELLAVSANRIGLRSNSGEGGEAAERYTPYTISGRRPPRFGGAWTPEAGDDASSRVKQVASGRFGVDATYLASAHEIEIKMAQGAKPGEGGQIPGFKVSAEIAAIRRTSEGTTLISPPPHHDIYSIEDLAQLIHDLKCVNPDAAIAVKLVATMGVGTVACGVAKAGADIIGVSGADGGTGAAALSSIKHAGLPWEFGLALAQRALSDAGLRRHVRLRADGGIATGRDVVLATVLGADEVGVGTSALIAAGCIMARRCHDNSCPVGVATQDPKLRAKLPGKPEHVVAFFAFLAEEIRGHLSALGARTLGDLTGRVDLLEAITDGRQSVDLDGLLTPPSGDRAWGGLRNKIRWSGGGASGLSRDETLLREVLPAIEGEQAVTARRAIDNNTLSVGAAIAGEIGRRRLLASPTPRAIDLTFTGVAGQSFGAFCTDPMRIKLAGVAQDGVGKGMSGGEIVIRLPGGRPTTPGGHVVAGNSALYGATGGRAFFGGLVGERFGVRNSGAIAVAEGCGDHGCEYMTGGVVAMVGPVGRNFGAGMTGGLAFVLELDGYLDRHCAPSVVVAPVGPHDAPFLERLLREHVRRTGSLAASRLLQGPDPLAAAFRIVTAADGTPTGYSAPPDDGSPAVAVGSIAAPTLRQPPGRNEAAPTG